MFTDALATRLIEWIGDQEDECDSEAGDEEDALPRNPRARDPHLLARAAGVSLQWHLISCPSCSAVVIARLEHESNCVECAHCHHKFAWCEKRSSNPYGVSAANIPRSR